MEGLSGRWQREVAGGAAERLNGWPDGEMRGGREHVVRRRPRRTARMKTKQRKTSPRVGLELQSQEEGRSWNKTQTQTKNWNGRERAGGQWAREAPRERGGERERDGLAAVDLPVRALTGGALVAASSGDEIAGAATIVPGAGDLGAGRGAPCFSDAGGTADPRKDCAGEEGDCRT